MLADVLEIPVHETYEEERKKPMPSLNHSVVQSRINGLLYVNYDDEYTTLSEISLELPNVKKSVPDLAVYPKLKINWESDSIRMTNPPITVIEILSPKQNLNDIISKFSEIYFPSGVKTAWLVIPPINFIAIYTPDMNYKSFLEGILTDETTGIELSLTKIFAV